MKKIKDDENLEVSTLFKELKETISKQKTILGDIKKLYGVTQVEDKKIISTEIQDLLDNSKELSKRIDQILEELNIQETAFPRFFSIGRMLKKLKMERGLEADELEKETLKRLKTKSKKEKENVVEKYVYAKFANKIFSSYSKKLIEKKYFQSLEIDLEKANLNHTLPGYVSIILLTTLISLIAGLIIFVFFIFFKIEPHLPIINLASDFGSRAIKIIWIPIFFPIAGFFASYFYPSWERKADETQIDYELPFATINMAAIAGSMINPVKIFEIILASEEFPYIKKELTKLMNEINIYGYDLVNALRNSARNTPSKKMAELFGGIATTINSGGDLAQFFEKRAESLLFEYRLKREKETKLAETFMDIYISIVIAAPMIFMLLLIMIKITGLGISLSTGAITLVMVLGVAMINFFFLIFLHLKKTG